MKTIDISKRKFSNLQPLILSNKIVNTEAVIYHFRYSSDYDGVLKNFIYHLVMFLQVNYIQ